MAIYSHTDKNTYRAVNMTYITEEEELQLDKGNAITIERDGIKHTIIFDKVYAYGEIDFHRGTEDYYTIEDFDWLKSATVPFYLPSDYNYNNSTVGCRNKVSSYKWTETFNSAEIARYIHCRIGKPKRILIFAFQHDKH